MITDARTVISRKALLDSGYTIGYIKEIDPTTGNEVMRGLVTGSAILSTETLRKKKADGSYEDVAFSAIQSALAPQNFAYQSALYPIEDLLANDVIFEYYHPTVAQAINGYFNV